MRIKLLTMALACTLLASAQNVTITNHAQLLKGTERNAFNPVLSSDGQKLLFSEDNYQGLKMYDFANDVTVKITDDAMAGFCPTISADGNSVYYLSQERVQGRVYRSMKNFNVKGATEKVVVAKERGMLPPVKVKGGVMVVSDKGRKMTAKVNSKAVYGGISEMVLVVNGVEKHLAPVATPHMYMWVSLSPDGQKILFYAGGKGAFVCDLNGKNLVSLGKFTAPAWYGNDFVVAQHSTSDGHQYESSQIMLLKADASFKQALTKPESMAMNPTASGLANKVVYNTIDGRLFVMELSIK